ncbi:hypothetical protein [Clostridium taeniosporum]|uniref:Uncharacterized protein n=1 Tax=Clostridium taeniosporum TaxID=394958 RepID=A0A1D7XL10_9CLOT|nr:hypothetical protein [Clostridium taeniosporum]AOR24028.1 hypothetical protein BGI42_09925 [Clostridium taeniosporum]
MEWQRVENSFILTIDNIKNINKSNNFKTCSNICDLNYSLDFSLDDITNISYDLSISKLSSPISFYDKSITSSNTSKYINNLKILISLRIEYKINSGIKIRNLYSSIGNFIVSDNINSNINICPKLMCLWKSNYNDLFLTMIYELVENTF